MPLRVHQLPIDNVDVPETMFSTTRDITVSASFLFDVRSLYVARHRDDTFAHFDPQSGLVTSPQMMFAPTNP